MTTLTIDKAGNKLWTLNGKVSRKEWANGSKSRWSNGELHCEGAPAVEWANGDKHWYLNGEEIIQPESFDTMESWFEYLNANEEKTYNLIHDHNGFISFINNPTAKQIRFHQMARVS